MKTHQIFFLGLTIFGAILIFGCQSTDGAEVVGVVPVNKPSPASIGPITKPPPGHQTVKPTLPILPPPDDDQTVEPNLPTSSHAPQPVKPKHSTLSPNGNETSPSSHSSNILTTISPHDSSVATSDPVIQHSTFPDYNNDDPHDVTDSTKISTTVDPSTTTTDDVTTTPNATSKLTTSASSMKTSTPSSTSIPSNPTTSKIITSPRPKLDLSKDYWYFPKKAQNDMGIADYIGISGAAFSIIIIALGFITRDLFFDRIFGRFSHANDSHHSSSEPEAALIKKTPSIRPQPISSQRGDSAAEQPSSTQSSQRASTNLQSFTKTKSKNI